MSNNPSDTTLLNLLKTANSPAAAGRKYGRATFIDSHRWRGKLRERTRRVADEEDVALSAFDSFFRGVEHGRFPKLNDGDDLWQVLLLLTERKAIDAIRRQSAAKRGGGEVRGDSVFVNDDGSPDREGMEKLIDAEPAPEVVVAFSEQCESLLARLQDSELQAVVLYKLEGYTNDEIAQKLGRVVRSIERKLQTIRKIWEREFEE